MTTTMTHNTEASAAVVNGWLPTGEATGHAASVPSDPFFEQVNYIGAIDPNNDWTKGWTTSAQN